MELLYQIYIKLSKTCIIKKQWILNPLLFLPYLKAAANEPANLDFSSVEGASSDLAAL